MPGAKQQVTSWFFNYDFDALDANLARIEKKLDALIARTTAMEAKMALDFTAANAEITRNTGVVSSVKVLLDQLTAMILDLKNSTTDPAAQAAIDALVTQLKANNDATADAVVANTPAA